MPVLKVWGGSQILAHQAEDKAMKRGHLTVEQWAKVIKRFEASGMEQRAFATKAGVSFPGLKYWLYKIRRQRAKAKAQAPRQVEAGTTGLLC